MDAGEIEGLVDRTRQGDKEALARLFDFYRDPLRRMIAFRMDDRLRGRIAPSDVLQEAYLQLEKKMADFATKDMSFFVWLRLVTHERLLGFHREHLATQKRDARREVKVNSYAGGTSSVFLAAHLLGNHTSIMGRAIREEQKAQLEAVLDTMEDVDREIIALRIFEGLSNGEVAEVLGLSKQTASKRFLRAIERIRSLLEQLPGFEP
jgi:RNA polymerase sigma-70 factor (ECF subfamily)